MSTHDQGLLAAHSLGALTAAETVELEQHLADCPECQLELDELTETRGLLDSIPPEALLDGAAEDSDLLLARILRAAETGDTATPAEPPDTAVAEATDITKATGKKAAKRRPGGWRRGLLVAAAVVIIAGAFGGGMLTGQHGGGAPSQATAESGTQTFTAFDPGTGVGMSMDVTNGLGWVALEGHFTGVTPGTPCDIYVITKSGQRILSGGWVAPPNANTATISVYGSAIVPPTDVASIAIVTTQGRQLVTTSV